jgi:aerobic carbon-monoxide dehydrogenase large subunit
VLGQSTRRVEDLPLLTGAGRFAADIRLDREVYMRVVRSPVAHGRLRGIDATKALSLPGVLGVWTGGDPDGGPTQVL